MSENSNRIKINDLEFDTETGELIVGVEDVLDDSPAFSGVRNNKVYVNNRLTPIDAKKFLALPLSIQERILLYPNSDYARDVLAEPIYSVSEDNFPNFKNISYTTNCEAIIMNNDNGDPVRAQFFMG